ncbi:peptidoglycan-binding protein [Sandarakinorhabdus cyanobacteriorum]|uniref:Peptidoglycan-binding protein n=1 Tax=Sandarakinorhabdus cyanobacteriorum TaxID=1981098 RepID=A0A255YZT7_9SPHN|nr:peptidoglycan-binding domain-containing protein [Sandarakinorhabdus cyanobacteriorum]OYQ34757.1 peptidoglycan-binding protein [Sandarakinorhabdus cyanobacteriorum]
MNPAAHILEIGSSRIGQRYILGSNVPLDNPNWSGPWDCAEFASWCVYQAFGFLFGVGATKNVAKAEPYSGHWADDAKKYGRVIAWEDALRIPGAALIRVPKAGKIGHVAFAMGDGDRTLEARGAAFGVGIFSGAAERTWSFGCMLPGVDYDDVATGTAELTAKPKLSTTGYLWEKKPHFKGANVLVLQRALQKKGVDPGPIDGDFGHQTHSALVSFQIASGIEVDGVFGKNSADRLGLSFPIVPTPADIAAYESLKTPKGPTEPVVSQPQAAPIDTIASIQKQGPFYVALTASGFSFKIGSATSYHDDMSRVGLRQGTQTIQDTLQFGVYRAADFSALGQWAHFIEPTLTAEGGARFATLNTYDRAAFTFGAPQFAAHTPRENLVEYVRLLLALPEAAHYFPDLSLRPNAAGRTTIHLVQGATFVDLERETEVVRPNGRKETQIVEFMRYLNSSPTEVDENELNAAARLMLWLKLDTRARQFQIDVFVATMKSKLAYVKNKVPAFTGADWEEALWIMDIRHQGRGSIQEIAAALAKPDRIGALRQIGAAKYKSRVDTVAAAVVTLKSSGVLDGFHV